MSIPTKNSRRIMVEGQKYLWRLMGHRRFRGNSYSNPTVTIQAEGFPGQVLQCKLRDKERGGQEADMDLGEVGIAQVTPTDIRSLILAGLKSGWTPLARSRVMFRLGHGEVADYTVEVIR